MIQPSPSQPTSPEQSRMRPCLGFTLRACAVLSLLLLIAAGCSSKKGATPTQAESHSQQTTATATTIEQPTIEAITAADPNTQSESCITPQQIKVSEQNRDSCFRLQPARTVLVKQASGKKAKASSKGGKTSKSTTKTTVKGTAKSSTNGKTTQKSSTTVKAGKTTKPVAANPLPTVERTVGLCQPQSLIYARCRTGIKTCQMGDTSPVQWFACARKNGATTAIPVAGSVIIIDTHRERNMDTGHPAYVEEVQRNDDGTWKLRISHTNYDRKCHLDQDAQVLFDPRTMTATFQTGPWAPWAHRLRVLGFIVR